MRQNFSMQGAWRRFASVTEAVGPFRAAALAPLWAVSRRFIVSTCEVTDAPADAADTFWQRLGEEAVQLVPAINSVVTADDVRRLLEQGAACYVLLEEGRIVHYRWYVAEPLWLPFLQVRWIPEPGDYTTVGVFTIPEFRGRGLHQRLSRGGLARARELGLSRSISIVAWWNRPALAVIRGVGFQRVGTATLWKAGAWTMHSARGAAEIRNGELRVARAGS